MYLQNVCHTLNRTSRALVHLTNSRCTLVLLNVLMELYMDARVEVSGNRCSLASFAITCQQGNQSLLKDLPQHFRFMVSAEF